MAELEPFDPKKHKPIRTVGNRYATEYLASEKSPEGKAWNIPTIWFDTETKEPVFLSETKEKINEDGTVTKYFSNDKAWNAAFKYEEETGKKFPRFKDIPTAVKAAEKRSDKGGASEKKLTMDEGGLSKQTEKAFSSNPLEGKETVKRLKNVGQFATEMLPGVGEVVTAKEIKKDYDKSNWVGVGLGAVALGVGLIPGVGDVASRGIKKLNKKIRSSLSKGKEINDTFTGEVNLVHGFYGDAPTKKFEKDFQGARYEETGGAYGGGVYLEDPENLYFNTPELDKRMYLPRTVQVSTKFNKAFVLKPSTVKKLEKITGVDLKSTAFISSGNAAVEEAGQAVTKKLKDLGYDGLIIKDFSEQDISKLYNNPKYKKALANYEANKNSDIAYKNFIKEADKIDEAQYKFDAKQGLNSYLTQPQIISLSPEKLNVVDELPRKFVSSKTNPKYLESVKQIPKNPKFSEGGATMNRQMNLAFMQEGGMKDDGMDKDPVSGNDIPAGSMAKEVRDDIPAQLSEGEYVVPADVVQYYGVKFFEDLRREAKIGLTQMDKDGRIGGEPVSVTMIALGQEEEKKKAARGGMMGYTNGGITNASLQAQQAAANPMAGFGYTGQSLSKPPTQANVPITTMETWYHPDGRTQVVQLVNGQITPPEMVKYTQPPWSKDASISNKPKRDDDDGGGKPTTEPGYGVDPNKYNFTNYIYFMQVIFNR